MSSLMLVRNLNKTIGNACYQFLDSWQRIAAFNERCQCSMIPLVAGWYAVVLVRSQLRRLSRTLNSWDWNCVSWSVVMVLGAPKRSIQMLTTTSATFSAKTSCTDVVSGHLVNQSLLWYPCITGNRPTISKCTWSNLVFGTGNCSGRSLLCLWILFRWHCKQVLIHSVIFLFISGHTNRFPIILRVTCPLGYANPCVIHWIFFFLSS